MDPEPRNDPREQTSAMQLEREKRMRELGVDLSAVARKGGPGGVRRILMRWQRIHNEDRIHLTLRPACIKRGGTNYLVLRTSLLKAYGFFAGRVRLEDGRWVEISEADRLFGSAEAVMNDW